MISIRMPLTSPRSLGKLEAEPVAPARDVADRWRREMRGAHQGAGIAGALQESPPRHRRLFRIEIGAHRDLGIARLQRRVDQIAGDNCLCPATPELDRVVVRRMAWSRLQA